MPERLAQGCSQSPLYGWVHWTAAQAVSGMAGDETGSKLRYNVMFYLEP